MRSPIPEDKEQKGRSLAHAMEMPIERLAPDVHPRFWKIDGQEKVSIRWKYICVPDSLLHKDAVKFFAGENRQALREVEGFKQGDPSKLKACKPWDRGGRRGRFERGDAQVGESE